MEQQLRAPVLAYLNDIGLTSVRCRGLLVPCKSMPAVLARSVRPLIFETDDPTYNFSMRGSCSLVRSPTEYLVIFTEHQRRDFAAQSIRVVSGFTGGNPLSVDTFLVVNPNDGEEYEDIRALRVSKSHHNASDLTDFYMLSDHLPPIRQARMLIAVGVPTFHSRVEYEPTHVHAGTICIPCVYQRPWPSVRGLHTVRTKAAPGRNTWPLDGLSGGAIFSIDGTCGSYTAHLRGISLRGGHESLHYMDIAAVGLIIQKMAPGDRGDTRLTGAT